MTANNKSVRQRPQDARGKKTAEGPVDLRVDQPPERIAKRLARAGVASRRDAERMIEAGRIRVNGKVLTTPATTVTPADRIEVDGAVLRGAERTRLWLYHKPAGLVTTHKDPEGRPTVFEKLPTDLPRVLSVGRLDINTEGLLLLTNDGGLGRVLELPATGWLRRYRVRAHGRIDQPALDRLSDGFAVDGVLYGAIEATLDRIQGSNVWITMGIREGKNREIKNVLSALGLEVNRLIRISYGPFQLSDLKEGTVREIKGRTLRDQLGPRLIEEAGADFEAPLHQDSAREAGPRGGQPQPKRKDNRKKDAPDRPERIRRDSGKEDRTPPKQQRRSRASNVWMAPGARPVNPRKQAAEKPDAGGKTGNRAKPGKTGPSGGKRSRRGSAGDADRRR